MVSKGLQPVHHSSSLPLLLLTLCSCSSVGPSHRLQLFRVEPLCHGVFCTGWRGIHSSTLSTSSPSFITLFYLSLVGIILPFLKCVFSEVPASSLTDSAAATVGLLWSWLELRLAQGSPWSLPTEAPLTPPSPLPKPCHWHPVHLSKVLFRNLA